MLSARLCMSHHTSFGMGWSRTASHGVHQCANLVLWSIDASTSGCFSCFTLLLPLSPSSWSLLDCPRFMRGAFFSPLQGYRDIVQQLLAAGADVHLTTSGAQQTALHMAALDGHDRVQRVLSSCPVYHNRV